MEIIKFITLQILLFFFTLIGTNIVVTLLYDYILSMMEISKKNNINRLKKLSIEIDNLCQKRKNYGKLVFAFHTRIYSFICKLE
jgi:hypothetical protein